MNSPALAEAAVARWISFGLTSLTHPILARIYADCFGPLGIEADWFEAEPFSSLEAGLPDGWLRSPRWNPAGISPEHSAAADLVRWSARAAEVTVAADGLLRLPPAGAADPDPWLAIRQTARARGRASALLCAAAGSLLFDPAAAATYAAGNDEEFFRTIAARLDAANRSPKNSESSTERTADEPAAQPAAPAPEPGSSGDPDPAK